MVGIKIAELTGEVIVSECQTIGSRDQHNYNHGSRDHKILQDNKACRMYMRNLMVITGYAIHHLKSDSGHIAGSRRNSNNTQQMSHKER